MAGDWIKMRVDLQTHPKVVRIMSALQADKFRVIGALHAVWSIFDAHSEDGSLDGYTMETMDSSIGWAGFSAAMGSVGWLVQKSQVLVASNFNEHNGRTAKRRAMETHRKKSDRKLSASDADKKRTREEKRREEVNPFVGSALPTCPHREILNLYREVLPELPQPRIWEGSRQTNLAARWRWVLGDLAAKDKPCDKAAGLDFFRRLFGYVRESDFLMGRSSAQWSAELGWLVKSENFAKILQGNYEKREKAA